MYIEMYVCVMGKQGTSARLVCSLLARQLSLSLPGSGSSRRVDTLILQCLGPRRAGGRQIAQVSGITKVEGGSGSGASSPFKHDHHTLNSLEGYGRLPKASQGSLGLASTGATVGPRSILDPWT